jgi:hypothetical protein
VPGNALPLISLKRFDIKTPFAAECVVHALPADLHRLQQVIGRGSSVAFRPENGHCPCHGYIAIELFSAIASMWLIDHQ